MPNQDINDLLHPENLNSVAGLSLIAKMMVAGAHTGLHRSRRVGQGMEFSQYRAYEPGDDLRLMDWKMLARSGRYYIKQSEVDTQVSVKFIVDCSKSMEYREAQFSKLGYARIIVAILAYLCQKQGDMLSLYALNDKQLHHIPSKVRKQQFNRILLELLKLKNEGKWPENTSITEKLKDRGRKELVFFITDLYEEKQELSSFIENLKTPRNEVVVFHLMGGRELDFEYGGNFTFEDLESGKRLKIDTKKARKTYLNNLNDFLEDWKSLFLNQNISYELLNLEQAIHQIIPLFLKKRNSMR